VVGVIELPGQFTAMAVEDANRPDAPRAVTLPLCACSGHHQWRDCWRGVCLHRLLSLSSGAANQHSPAGAGGAWLCSRGSRREEGDAAQHSQVSGGGHQCFLLGQESLFTTPKRNTLCEY
jgi:hypothetical protein